ncbi:MAG: VOC family protein [Bacteroidetes bacterium]|nr:MAG: VOC family protein [Bacteroidota bacterium]
MISGIHHVAIICSDIKRSVHFYTEILGFEVINSEYRESRKSWKVDMLLNDLQIELFTFSDSIDRPSYPEAKGLRHLALKATDIVNDRQTIIDAGVMVEEIRTDSSTGKRFCFFSDPDGLPIELYEI